MMTKMKSKEQLVRKVELHNAVMHIKMIARNVLSYS